MKIGFAYSKPFFVVLWRVKVFFPNLLLCLKAKLAGTSCEYSISTSNMDAFYNKNLHILTKLQRKTKFEKCHIMVFFLNRSAGGKKSDFICVGYFMCKAMPVVQVPINLGLAK